jgi:hypothetical protein
MVLPDGLLFAGAGRKDKDARLRRKTDEPPEGGKDTSGDVDSHRDRFSNKKSSNNNVFSVPDTVLIGARGVRTVQWHLPRFPRRYRTVTLRFEVDFCGPPSELTVAFHFQQGGAYTAATFMVRTRRQVYLPPEITQGPYAFLVISLSFVCLSVTHFSFSFRVHELSRLTVCKTQERGTDPQGSMTSLLTERKKLEGLVVPATSFSARRLDVTHPNCNGTPKHTGTCPPDFCRPDLSRDLRRLDQSHFLA